MSIPHKCATCKLSTMGCVQCDGPPFPDSQTRECRVYLCNRCVYTDKLSYNLCRECYQLAEFYLYSPSHLAHLPSDAK